MKCYVLPPDFSVSIGRFAPMPGSYITGSQIREILLADGWHKVEEFFGVDNFAFESPDSSVEECISWNERVGAEHLVPKMEGRLVHMIVPVRAVLAIKSYPLKKKADE